MGKTEIEEEEEQGDFTKGLKAKKEMKNDSACVHPEMPKEAPCGEAEADAGEEAGQNLSGKPGNASAVNAAEDPLPRQPESAETERKEKKTKPTGKRNPRNMGILFIILSAVCFTFMNAFVRLAGDLPSVQKSFFRNLVAFFVALIMILRSGDGFHVEKGNWKFMFLRAGAGTVGILCNYYAVDHLVLSDASMLNKMSPFFVTIFSWLILKEKLKPKQAVAIAVAFAGSLFIIKPTFTNMELGPSIIGFIGGVAAGLAYAMVRLLGQRGQKGSSIVLFFSAFSCLATLPYLIFNFHPMTWVQLLTLLGAGLAAAGGQFAITAAYLYAPAREISVYDYTQIIFSAVLGFFLFGQIPDGYSVIGYVIICGMAVWMFIYNNRLEREEQTAAA